ncbi:MAG: major facilitator superfamily domain-containing protein 7 [Clostridiales bacterium]|nr:major facilitator superfamily domain-containing protein 7 [Clostridiales bacterium]
MTQTSIGETKSVSSYRWVILLTILPSIISTEMMWLSLAPVSSLAEAYFGVSSMSIALFSMSYMIMFILFTFPASWVIDKFGYKPSLVIGSGITAVFGIIRFFFADNFSVVLLTQFIIAAGQPFLLNISTKAPANWFPVEERSTAAGILTMAQYVGFAVPMLVAPALAESSGIPSIFLVFAIIATISAVAAIVFTKEHPPVPPPGPIAIKEDLSLKAISRLLKNKSFVLVLLICFISIGVFNTILTVIESILTPRGITQVEAGIIGAIFVVAGVVGAIVLPIISDKSGRRIPFFVGAIALLVPVYLGFTFLPAFLPVAVIAGIAGFSIMGVAPILFQHGAEVAYPAQEGTSLGVILLMGQISGALFVYLFEALSGATASIVLPMLLIVILTALELPLTIMMKESGFGRKNN